MKALVLVDLQNDFMPTGSLPVKNGMLAVQAANVAIPHFNHIIATKDWHPKDHQGFASQHESKEPFSTISLDGIEQVLWPDHCVQNTFGAELVSSLHQDRIKFVVQKGQDPNVDSYSGFFDNARRRKTELSAYLESHKVTDLYIMGVALDYCVKFTALDACSLGFKTHVVIDGCHGIASDPVDLENVVQEMNRAGIQIITLSSLSHHGDR